MNTLIVHILAGEQALLEPEITPGTALAMLCGPDYSSVPAYWLSSECGNYEHEFLTESREDNRVSIFARSLVTDYSGASRPILIIPRFSELSAETMADWGPVLQNLQDSILAFGRKCLFHLHMLTLPDIKNSFEKLEELQSWMIGQGLTAQVAEDALIYASLEEEMQSRFGRNLFASKVFAEVTVACRLQGICLSDSKKLKSAVLQRIKYMTGMGLQPVMPHDDALVARFSAAIIADAAGPVLPITRHTT